MAGESTPKRRPAKKEILPVPEPATPKPVINEAELKAALSYEDQTDPFNDMTEMVDEKSDAHKLAREFISFEDIEGKTELTKKQARAFTALHLLDKKYPELGFAELRHYLWIVTSVGGKGRSGLLEMLRGRIDIPPAGPIGEGEMRRL